MPEIREELAGWIETDVIADAILEGMGEQSVTLTLDNAKTVWLDILENELHDAIRSSLIARFDIV